MRESDFYPAVARWLSRQRGCFVTGSDTGLRHGRIDVVGIRDVGGDLSGESEIIGVEVKRGNEPFSKAAGQAHSYSVYADRCYLAEARPRAFGDEETAIASHLGIGLLALRANASGAISVREVLSAPLQAPLDGLRLQVVEKLGYSVCSVCRSLFQRGDGDRWSARVSRGDRRRGDAVSAALRDGHGLVYWLTEASGRDIRQRKRLYRRRYVCPDCVSNLFGELMGDR